MSNKTQLQTNNANLQSFIDRVNAAKDIAASLPDAGTGGGGSIDPISGMPIVRIPGGTSSLEMQPNTYYILEQPVSLSLNISFASGTTDTVSEYVAEIRADDDDINIFYPDNIS
jgi:hypothetical protein